jgi:hypothetical protein
MTHITIEKEKLEQLLEAWQTSVYGSDSHHKAMLLAMTKVAAQARSAPTVQEPVAWRNAALRVGEDLCSVGPFGYYDMTAEQWLDWALSVVTVHAPPTAQPAPVQSLTWLKTIETPGGFGKFVEAKPNEKGAKPVYLTPPAAQRQWVGLTDDDYVEMGISLSLPSWQYKAIEAKLRSKNT